MERSHGVIRLHLKCMQAQLLQGHELQRLNVRCLKTHRRCKPRGQGLAPAASAETPAVARSQPCKAMLGPGCDQVIATRQRVIQKFSGHLGANHMGTFVVFIGIAAAVPEVASQRGKGTGLKWASKNIQCSHIDHYFKMRAKFTNGSSCRKSRAIIQQSGGWGWALDQ